MSVVISKSPGGVNEISEGTMANPVNWIVAVTDEEQILDQKLYIRMFDSNTTATNGRIYAQDIAGTDESYWVKFAHLKENGPFEEWGPGPGDFETEIEFELGVGDEIAFWVRITTDAMIGPSAKGDLKIAVDYIEHS